ncbi:small ribosomal subunit protein mS34 [Prorops nasuta]|uniref:small ribosomal subunit protein mS34 n=1 Tax=Prorops nasuta TaxID=863751 RepID=UPI0034D01EEA
MPIQLIGRTTNFSGKPLWEILGNLKNFGVGRMVIRYRNAVKYSEPSYIRILKVQAAPYIEDPDSPDRLVYALVENTFRGKTKSKPVQIDSVSYKADYRLVPKDEEHLYEAKKQGAPEIIVPRTMELPPMYKLFIKRLKKTDDESVNEMPIYYNRTGHFKNFKIVERKESPMQIVLGVGKTVSPSLYANVKYDD